MHRMMKHQQHLPHAEQVDPGAPLDSNNEDTDTLAEDLQERAPEVENATRPGERKNLEGPRLAQKQDALSDAWEEHGEDVNGGSSSPLVDPSGTSHLMNPPQPQEHALPSRQMSHRQRRQAHIEPFQVTKAGSSLFSGDSLTDAAAAGNGRRWSSKTKAATRNSSAGGGGGKEEGGGGTHKRISSSLELRRLPTDILLLQNPSQQQMKGILKTSKEEDGYDDASMLSDDEFVHQDKLHTLPGATVESSTSSRHKREEDAIGTTQKDLLHWVCLRPGYSLWTQLMLSFGSISLLTVFTVVATCIVVAVLAGNEVKGTSRGALEEIAQETQSLTARYLAESLSEELLLDDSVRLLKMAIQDRFAGYPNGLSDEFVPFPDAWTGENKYPIDFPPPPLDWQFESSNVNPANYFEHFQNQQYYAERPASTETAVFVFKGICDPAETDPSADSFWPNCTDANNDIMRGGAWEPTKTTAEVYYKSKDLIPLMKAIFESRDGFRDVGIYFSNDGAGATLSYPFYALSTQTTYTSDGCEWMNMTNFYDPTRPIGTPEMIRRCSPQGDLVSNRIYNPLEREWCAVQAMDPQQIHFSASQDAWDVDKAWMLVMGQAVYDQITNEFIACTYLGLDLGDIDNKLRQFDVVEGDVVSLVKWSEDGRVIGTSSRSQVNNVSQSIYDMEVGVSRRDFEKLFNLVEFDTPWTPQQIRQSFESFLVESDRYFISVYPMPPIPESYDPTYHPLFLVVVSTPLDSLHAVVDEASRIVDDQVLTVIRFCLSTGAVGLALALMIISMMASMLTRPLRKMSKIAGSIVASFGDPEREREVKQKEDILSRKEALCTPKTELSEVVAEFDKMVVSFSGSHMVTTERHKYRELFNMFTLKNHFSPVYESRGEKSFQYAIESPLTRPWLLNGQDENSNDYVHPGSNLSLDNYSMSTITRVQKQERTSHWGISSPLFTWIVALIVTPLLVVSIAIAAIALHSVSSEFAKSIDEAETFFLEVERTKLEVHSQLRADFVQSLTTRTTSDLHVLTRYMGWLVFGAINLSETYTEILSGSEQCKNYSSPMDCPYSQEAFVCDCAWEDASVGDCDHYPRGSSRRKQRTWWGVQSSDADDETGNRNSTSFPKHSTSPSTTEWWDDQLTVPGAMMNATDAGVVGGYENLFQRLRSTVAMPLFQSIYNSDVKDKRIIGSHVAFEADGLFVGYNGCAAVSTTTSASNFQSNFDNGAPVLRSEICPERKFGYDPRCRGWYDRGRKLALERKTLLHITPPYVFATEPRTIAQSATSPMIDPRNGKYVGQVLYDFSSTRMIEVLQEDSIMTENGFPVLVAAETAFESDAVVSPGYRLGDLSRTVSHYVMKNDIHCTTPFCIANLEYFQAVLKDMKTGSRQSVRMTRTNDAGAQETIILAYSPIRVRSLSAADSSNFSRGIQVSDYLIYSLGLAAREVELLEAFLPIEKEIEQQIRVAIAILSGVLVVATCLVVYVSLNVTKSIALPMVYLLDVIRSIRKASAEEDEPPDLQIVKASKEIVNFADSIEMLSKVVKSANVAFYAGEFEVAYFVLRDALRLFRRLDNKKAVGVACNNLGNVMMGLYQEMILEKIEKLGGLTKTQIVRKGIAYFHEAIQLGEKAYDEFHNLHGWTPICLDFMQHLSNRYFNRALFLLLVKEDHDKPDSLEELGKRDIQIACDMDSEIATYAEEIGWSSEDRIENMFDIKIVRLGGYNLLLNMGYEDDWDITDKLMDCLFFITAERRRPDSGLFRHITCPGRMQEVELEMMKYFQVLGDVETAAKVAVRSLFEDEKVFADTLSRAVDVLRAYVNMKTDMFGDDEAGRQKVLETLEDYATIIEDYVNHQNESKVFGESESELLSKATGGSGRAKSKRFSARSWSLEQSSGRFVTMEDF